MLALARIDDRLVHGQVVEGWIPHLRAQEVVVVSDAVAADPMQAMLMRLALPEEVALDLLTINEAARHPALQADYPKRVLLLAPGPLEIMALLERGARLGRVNVGGLHYTAGKVQLGKAIFLSGYDKEALREISRRGVRLEGRALPRDAEEDILALIEASA